MNERIKELAEQAGEYVNEVYENDLYGPFLEHTKQLYRNRFKEHFGVEE